MLLSLLPLRNLLDTDKELVVKQCPIESNNNTKKRKPTWRDVCKAIALTKDYISQQWVGPGCIACFALATAGNKNHHALPQTARLEQPWIATVLVLMPFLKCHTIRPSCQIKRNI